MDCSTFLLRRMDIVPFAQGMKKKQEQDGAEGLCLLLRHEEFDQARLLCRSRLDHLAIYLYPFYRLATNIQKRR